MGKLGEIISRNEERIRTDWINDMAKSVQRADLISKVEIGRADAHPCSARLRKGASSGQAEDVTRHRLELRPRASAGHLRLASASGLYACRDRDLSCFRSSSRSS